MYSETRLENVLFRVRLENVLFILIIFQLLIIITFSVCYSYY